MNKNIIGPSIAIYENVLEDAETLTEEIEGAASLNTVSWITNDNNSEMMSLAYSSDYLEDFSSAQAAFNSSISNLFLDGLQKIELDYFSENRVYLPNHDNYVILKYSNTAFNDYIDDHPEYRRRVSVLLSLGDSDVNIRFNNFNISHTITKNSAVVFPSSYAYSYSIEHADENPRYLLMTWIK